MELTEQEIELAFPFRVVRSKNLFNKGFPFGSMITKCFSETGNGNISPLI